MTRYARSHASTPLAALHNYLQWVMGWQDKHAHEFEVGEQAIAPAWWIAEMSGGPDDSRYKDESRVSVAKVVAELGISGEFKYVYDMGDDWTHRIVIEAPPVTQADPAHEDHVSMQEWVGGVFDPKGFDLNRINRDWKSGDKQGK